MDFYVVGGLDNHFFPFGFFIEEVWLRFEGGIDVSFKFELDVTEFIETVLNLCAGLQTRPQVMLTKRRVEIVTYIVSFLLFKTHLRQIWFYIAVAVDKLG